MKTVTTLEDLSVGEMVRIRHQLHQRFGIGQRGNIIEVAFGLAEKNERVDLSRPNAVCFYVRHKRMPRALVDRIPAMLELRLKRGRQFVLVRLATDVIDLGPRQIRPTGEPIVHEQSTGMATTGGVVAWRLAGQESLSWGLLTVGHVLTAVATVPETKARVRIGGIEGSPIAGRLLARSRPRSRQHVDAALVEVDRASLVRANLIPASFSPWGKRIRPIQVLKNDRGNVGFTFPERTQIEIRVVRFLPISDMVPALGLLNFVIEADAGSGAFRGGRSGSTWAVEGQAACMQHGGLPSDFSRGWGQSLEYVLWWCTGEIARINGRSVEEVDLRLIRVV